MNNNRGNNRRRGRGNNRQQGNQQLNRIDSRARGNAPQMLEKYKKLAHDAHLNGDRVQEEYYLQFADHYFRVMADQKQRQDEARQRRDDRPQDGDADRHDDPRDPYSDYDSDEPYASRPVENRPVENRPPETRDTDPEPARESGDQQVYEPAENPFVREGRAPRSAPKPRKPRRSPQGESADDGDAGDDARDAGGSSGVDPSVLPPSIGITSSDEDAEPAEAAKPRRRTRKPRAADDSGETLEAVN